MAQKRLTEAERLVKLVEKFERETDRTKTAYRLFYYEHVYGKGFSKIVEISLFPDTIEREGHIRKDGEAEYVDLRGAIRTKAK